MNYYNDNEKSAVAWLKELIKNGVIPPGDVDERSIKDVQPSDLKGYTQCHFFAGIGGWSEALRIAGWPADRPVWTGSCPCQPLSVAGLGKGAEDERHLWPAFAELICYAEPSIVFGEQTSKEAGREWLSGIRADLEEMGYAVGSADLCAASVGSPNIRQRLFWVADATSSGGAQHVGESREGPRRIKEEVDSAEYKGPGGGLADMPGDGCREAGKCGAPPGSDGIDRNCSSDGMGDAFIQGLSERQEFQGILEKAHGSRKGEAIDVSGEVSGLAHPPLSKGTRQRQQQIDVSRSPVDGFWTEFELIPCADGKVRRIKPGLAPLVDGIPGRVGLIRGYGNAINPWVGAEFIGAYLGT
mgnify:CR=1 FL=1